MTFLFIGFAGCEQQSPTFQKARIDGDSMVPSFYGDHHRVQCSGCGLALRFDCKQSTGTATCGSCGSEIPFTSKDRRLFDRVSIHPFENPESIKRFDVIAINHPRVAKTYAIKRVVGLPNEEVKFQNGDLYINGRLYRSSLREQAVRKVPLYDSNSKRNRKRWRINAGQPTVEQNLIRFRENQESSIDFVNIRGYVGNGNANEPCHIQDNFAFNQFTSRKLNDVSEIALEFDLRLLHPSTGSLMIQIGPDPESKVSLELDFANRQANIVAPNKEVSQVAWKCEVNRVQRIYFSNFDGQATLAIDGHEILRFRVEKTLSEKNFTSYPISITSNDVAIELTKLKVFRDQFYLDEFYGDGAWQATTDATSFVLIGDNNPQSKDSRHWPEPAIHFYHVIGRVERLAEDQQ